jgi:hypothetical protein
MDTQGDFFVAFVVTSCTILYMNANPRTQTGEPIMISERLRSVATMPCCRKPMTTAAKKSPKKPAKPTTKKKK